MIEKHTAKNGLRIVSESMPSVRSVTIGIWVLTGSRNEVEANNGISHFLEHMFFKGTATRTAQDIAEAFDSIGGQVNAFTSKEYTCFYAKVLDTHKEYALEILSDMFFNSQFDEEEMEREKKVVYEEIKMYEDTPDDIIHDLLARASYGEHPLGYPILGTEKQLKTFAPDTLRDYIRKHYIPENVVVSVAGNVDDSFIKQIESHFGNYTYDKQTYSIFKPSFVNGQIKRHKDTEQAHLCIGYDGLDVGHNDIYSLIIMNNVLGGSMSSRLFQEVREKKGLAYSVFSYHSSFLDNGLLTIYAGTGKEQLPLLEETIDNAIKQFADQGLTDKELINSKEQLKGNLVLSLESTNSRMSRNGKNELILQRHRTLDEMIKEIDAVDHFSVKKVIDMIFSQSPSSALIAPEAPQ
ncbi:insulinase family protein [Virgibacillus halodenitrificans]|uniref:M16 family metallopeptidase n=1 Tax=Virgibacillus halodenitrificans TaxID=1482 RepID=UPI000EF534EB|nr:pitrilysin family protein [Virgibacillus halodenitrificans]MYL47759.1 insulinase family protein [Virgibacillus halodenitrificans]MYL57307.1 insulinase family protein [Virgibacillus halodenitrificans]WHX27209.1 pitrilysin family protein [Virgibacillus halodenitrificans]